jgi:diguanylate cyclase (GGDEF)-like protein
MRESIRRYIDLFEKILDFQGICWWLIDYAEDPKHFYCNETMAELFSLDPAEEKHSVARTCPIAGDYNRNVALAAANPTIANKIFDEYAQLVQGKISEYNNIFPYRCEKRDKTLYFSSRARVVEYDAEGLPAILFGIIEDITLYEEQRHDLKKLNDELSLISITDKLTGLFNRHHLNELLCCEHRNALSHLKSGTFGVILLDVDHFKAINDRYGHNKGDEVLAGVAEIIQSNVRNNDTVGRWGGEEFLVICPRIDRHDISRLAERLRSRVSSTTGSGRVPVTVSGGAALHRQKESIEQLIGRADRMLYQAKSLGRNRVMVA